MSKLKICNTGTTGRSVLSTEVVPLYKGRINQIKSKSNQIKCSHLHHKMILIANDYIFVFFMSIDNSVVRLKVSTSGKQNVRLKGTLVIPHLVFYPKLSQSYL